MLRGSGNHLVSRYAGANSNIVLAGIERDTRHSRQVDDEAVIHTPTAVTSGSYGDLELLMTREVDTARYVIVGFALREYGRVLVRLRVPPGHLPQLVVVSVARKNDTSPKARTKNPNCLGIRCPGWPVESVAAAHQPQSGAREDRRLDEISTCGHRSLAFVNGAAFGVSAPTTCRRQGLGLGVEFDNVVNTS